MFKKIVIKAAMFAFVMFGLSTYAGYLITGHLPPYLDKLKSFSHIDQLPVHPSWSDIGLIEHKNTTKKDTYEVLQSGKTVIYKWKNANGTWNYSSDIPPANVHAVRQKIEMPVASTHEETKANDKNNVQDNAESGQLINPYTPGGVKQMLDNAKQVRKQVEERNTEQEQHLKEI